MGQKKKKALTPDDLQSVAGGFTVIKGPSERAGESFMLQGLEARRPDIRPESAHPTSSVADQFQKTSEAATLRNLDKMSGGQFDAKLKDFLADSKIDPSKFGDIKQAIAAGAQIAQRIEQTPKGQDIQPTPGMERQELLQLEWFLRATTIAQGQEFGKGSMKIPDPDGKLALFLANCNPYFRLSSHWEQHHQEIGKTSFDLNGVKKIAFPKGKQALGFDFDKKNTDGLPMAGIKNTTMMAMLLPEKDAKGNTVLHVGFKSEGHSTEGGLATQVQHGLQWFKKKVANIETPSRYTTVRKEDKAPPELLLGIKDLSEIKEFSSAIGKIELKRGTLGSDPSLSTIDEYLQQCTDAVQAKVKDPSKRQELLQRIQQLRNDCLNAQIASTSKQVQFSSPSTQNALASLANPARDPKLSFHEQVNKVYTDAGLGEPSTLTTNSEVLLPSLSSMTGRLNRSGKS